MAPTTRAEFDALSLPGIQAEISKLKTTIETLDALEQGDAEKAVLLSLHRRLFNAMAARDDKMATNSGSAGPPPVTDQAAAAAAALLTLPAAGADPKGPEATSVVPLHSLSAPSSGSSRPPFDIMGAARMAETHYVEVHRRLQAPDPNGAPFLAGFEAEALEAFAAALLDRMESNYPDLWASVVASCEPDSLVKTTVASLAGQEDLVASNGKASTPRCVQANGIVQRGKSNIKLFVCALTFEINQSEACADKPFSFWVTIMVPWAEQAKGGVKRTTAGCVLVVRAEEDDADEEEEGDEEDLDSDMEGWDDMSDDGEESGNADKKSGKATNGRGFLQASRKPGDEVDKKALDALPVALLKGGKALFEEALKIAEVGGVVVLPRTGGSLKRAIGLKTQLNLQRKQDKKVAAPCFIALDEVDKMLGSCQWAGHSTPVPIKITEYERYLWCLCGLKNSGKGYPISYFDPTAKKGRGMQRDNQRGTALAHRPFMFMGISATGLAFFMWILHRVGLCHKGEHGEDTGKELFELVDVLSLKQGGPAAYVGQDDSTKFKGLVLHHQELGRHNFYNNSSTLALESNAAQTPKAALMMATTVTVSATAKQGIPSTRVCAGADTDMLIGKALGEVVCGQKVGYSEAGMLTLVLHGNHATFAGRMGLQYVSDSDVVGVNYLKKLHLLGKEKMRAHRANMRRLEDELEQGVDLAKKKEKDALDSKVQEYQFMCSDLADRIDAAEDHDEVMRETNQDVVNAYQEAANWRGLYEEMMARNPRPSEEALEVQLVKCQGAEQRAKAMRVAAATQRFELAHGAPSTEHGFKHSWFIGIELLRPLLMDWEEEQERRAAAVGKTFVRLIELSKKKNATTGRHALVMAVPMITTVLGFLRSLDSDDHMRELISKGKVAAPTVGLTDSESIPIKVSGYNMLRRAMSVVASIFLGDGERDALLTLTHVCQYAADLDGASCAQQVERFATILTDFIRRKMGDAKVQVLTGENTWVAMAGHRAYNRIPMFNKPHEERQAAINQLTGFLKGEFELPEFPDNIQGMIRNLKNSKYYVSNKQAEVEMTARNVRVFEALCATVADAPRELFDMCELLKKPCMAANAGRDWGHIVACAGQVAAKLNGREVVLKKAPAKKKQKGKEALVEEWAFEALRRLGAYCPRGGPFFRAVGHGVVWDEIIRAEGHRLRDAAEVQRLLEVQKCALDILNHGGEARSGGVGLALANIIKAGRAAKIAKGEEGNPLKQHGYYIPWDSSDPLPAASAAAASSSKAAGKRPAAAAAAASGRSQRAAKEQGQKARKAPKAWERAISDSEESEDEMEVEEVQAFVARPPMPKRKRAEQEAVSADSDSDSESDSESDDGDRSEDFRPEPRDQQLSDGSSDESGSDSEGYKSDDPEERAYQRKQKKKAKAVTQRQERCAVAVVSVPLACKSKEQVTNPAAIDRRLPDGWTQWVQQRPNGQVWTTYLSPRGRMCDSFKTRGEQGKPGWKMGVWEAQAKGL